MEGYDYDAAASTIKIEDITSDKYNREILRKLKGNDPELVELVVCKRGNIRGWNYYCPENARSLGWLGYYIGQNTKVKELHLRTNLCQGFNSNFIEIFCRGVNRNRSFQKISFHTMDLMGGGIFHSLRPFFENNNGLSEIAVEVCQFGAGCARQLSLALRDCNKSLKHIKLSNSQAGDEQLVEITQGLSAHPQLEKLDFWHMNIGRNGCTALANLLRHTTTRLQELTLFNNNIDDDEGVEALVGALTNNNRLRTLYLSSNRITARGCQSLAALLENPNCNLEELYLINNSVDDEGALIFANALARNRNLKTLDLFNNGITAEGWSSFSKVLCDTSSVNNTFLSNHTLYSLGDTIGVPADIRSFLVLNRSSEDKKEVGIKKILKYHQHFDMQPFFEWDLKVLPIAVMWFERARSIDDTYEAMVDKQKLGTIY